MMMGIVGVQFHPTEHRNNDSLYKISSSLLNSNETHFICMQQRESKRES
jgi:hypothetical protein